MGILWRAFDRKLGIEIALKALRGAHRPLKGAAGRTEGLASRLARREVIAARQVHAPNVCRVFDLVEEPGGGREFISMEFIDGVSLRDLLDTIGPLPLETAADIAGQFLTGLAAIHRADLLHRDIKPENIMITPAGRVVIVDFGLSVGAAVDRGSSLSGTRPYMAPEHAAGRSLDEGADIFAAGLVLAELTYLGPGPGGISWEKLHTTLREDRSSLPESPWRQAILRATRPRREDRFATAEALRAALVQPAVEPPHPRRPTPAPYPGLAGFRADRADVFFGREREVEGLLRRLRTSPWVGLIGPSGAGKSSLVHAGLVPALPPRWLALAVEPGRDPTGALARAIDARLADDPSSRAPRCPVTGREELLECLGRLDQRCDAILLVIDQFEELFTQNEIAHQERFTALLADLTVAADLHLLLVLRDDFLMECQRFAALAPLFSNLVPLGAPSPADLRRALVEPAQRFGYEFEDEDLIETMLDEVKDERGALPLLAFAAAQLWAHRQPSERRLTHAAYREIGGVSGALAAHGERTMLAIDRRQHPVVREVFRRLVTSEGTRIARPLDEILSLFPDRPQAAATLQTLVTARLLTRFDVTDGRGEATRFVEVVHESLLRSWPRLVEWRSQDAGAARIRDQLHLAATLWHERRRAPSLLWTGDQYRAFQTWHKRYAGPLTETEGAFAKAMHERVRRSRRVVALSLGAAFALLLTLALVMSGLYRASEAARRQALAAKNRADASRLFALAQVAAPHSPTRAVALATRSLDLFDDRRVRRFVLELVQTSPVAYRLGGATRRDVKALAFSPRGRWLAAGREDGDIELWSSPAAPPRLLRGHGRYVRHLAFSRDATRLLSRCYGDWTVKAWSPASGDLLRTWPLPDPGSGDISSGRAVLMIRRDPSRTGQALEVWPYDADRGHALGFMSCDGAAELDPTGRWVACRTDDQLHLLDLHRPAGADRVRVMEQAGLILMTAFDGAGRRLAAADVEGRVTVFELDRSEVRRRHLAGPPGLITDLRFDSSGDRLLVAGAGEIAQVWDLAGPPGARPLELRARSGIYRAAFHPGGRWVATTSAAGVDLWPLDGIGVRVLSGHRGQALAAAFTGGGASLVTSGDDGTLMRWSLGPGGDTPDRVLVEDRADRVVNLAAIAGGRRLLTASYTGKIRLVSLRDGSQRLLHDFGWRAAAGARALAVSPTGALVAAAGADDRPRSARVLVWDLAHDRRIELRIPEGAGARALAFTAGGDHLAASGDFGVRLWDLETGTSRLVTSEPAGDMAAHPGAPVLLVSRREGAPLVLDLVEGHGRSLERFGRRGVRVVAFDPRGELIVTGDSSGALRVGTLDQPIPHLLLGHRGAVTDVVFAPGGGPIASTAADGTVRLWSRPSGPSLLSLSGDELLGRLRQRTNYVALDDEDSAEGFRIDFRGPPPPWLEGGE